MIMFAINAPISKMPRIHNYISIYFILTSNYIFPVFPSLLFSFFRPLCEYAECMRLILFRFRFLFLFLLCFCCTSVLYDTLFHFTNFHEHLKNIQITIQTSVLFQTTELPKLFLFHQALVGLKKHCFTKPVSFRFSKT